MTELFISVLSKNITATYCILLVCVARIILRKAPRFYSYILWLIVGLRLLCPVYFESNFSLIKTGENLTFDNISEAIPEEMIHFVNTYTASPSTILNTSGSTESVSGGTQDGKVALTFLLDIFAVTWILGFLAVSIYHIWGLWRLHRKLDLTAKPSSACCLEDIIGRNPDSAGKKRVIPVWEAEELSVPFVMGILPFGIRFSPRIYLPVNLEEEERKYVLAHECTHIRRKDYLMKPFAFFLVCLNWFNPFIWLAFYLMNKDMEMSCDEAVIRGNGIDAKKQYSKTLLSLASRSKMTQGTLPAFGNSSIKSRIKNIMNSRKPGVWITLACILLVTLLILGLITNPKADSSQEVASSPEDVSSFPKDVSSFPKDVSSFPKDVSSFVSNALAGESPADTVTESRLWGTVNTDTLKVRAMPNDDGEVIGLLPKGEKIEIIAFDNMELPESSSLDGVWDRKYVAFKTTGEGVNKVAYVQSKYLNLMEGTAEATKRLWAAKEWAAAFCAKDGENLWQLAADKDSFAKLEMAEMSEQGELKSFGWSSPWPWGSYRLVFPVGKGEDIVIYYYAQTSDPNVVVWSQTLKMVDGLSDIVTLEELMQNVILSYSEVTMYDRITTSQAFLDAYAPGEESVQFYDFEAGGLTDAIAQQISDGNTEGSTTYGSPETAVVKLLNLYDGVAEIVKEDDKNAVVRYTFMDGTSVNIPMYVAVEEPKIWSVVSNIERSVLLNE